MKTFLLLAVLLLRLTNTAYSQTIVTYIPCLNDQDLRGSLYFANSNFAYTWGINFICKSTNGGFNWSVSPTQFNSILEVHFYNESIGYLANSNPTGFYKTTNGGLNWMNITVPHNNDISNFRLFSENDVVAFDNDSLIYSTTNGGQNWNTYRIPNLITVSGYDNTRLIKSGNDIYFCNRQLGSAPAYYSTKIYKSTNRGVSFSTFSLGNYRTNVLYGRGNKLWSMGTRTIYSGINWDNYSVITYIQDFENSVYTNVNYLGEYNNFSDMYMTLNGQGFVLAHRNALYKTSNFGQTWEWDTTYTADTLYAIEANQNHMYLMSYNTNNNVVKLIIRMNTVGISQLNSLVPNEYKLSQNYPNPFNPTTNINFSLPEKSFIKLTVYDINGKEICALVNSELQAGNYNVNFNSSQSSSGIYFYRINTTKFVETKRMILIK